VIELTEPQVWVLIGVFAVAIFGMLSWQTANFNRNLTAVGDSLRESVVDLGRIMDAKFTAQDAKFDARFEILERRLENMDRGIQAISRHVFGTDPR
jgi:predicted PurR-regulated permease PerM